MSEEQDKRPLSPEDPEVEPTAGGTEELLDQPAVPMNAQEVEEGKTFAILSWALTLVGLPFFIVPLVMRNNEFSLFHAKQCLILWIFGLVGSAISGVLMAICIGAVLAVIVWLMVIVFTIMGLISSVQGQAKPLPMIGQWGIEWFKGISKV